ncbi:MAG: hypothetical protein Q8M11_22410 [Sulfuritalea sp.]|nr:hypothetical protein [Sulfuritalea sp.]
MLAVGLTLFAIIFIEANADPGGRIFWHLLFSHDLPAAWLMVAMLAFGYWSGALWPGSSNWVDGLLLALDRWRYLVALALWVLLCFGSLGIYQNHPLSMDEYATVFQAKIFAAGALHGQFPPDLLDNLIPKGFQNHFLMVNRNTGAVFSAYWPGFSLLLAPFVWLGIPWACNPTLVAASFLLIGRIARDLIASPLAAGWALLFALASPAFVANGITYYSMSADLLFNLGFAWLLLSPSPLRLLLAGLVGGFSLVLHNPFPHLVFALPWILWLALRSERHASSLFWLAAGYLPVVAGLLVGWSLWQQQILQVGAGVSVAQLAPVAPPDLPDRAIRLLGRLLRVLQMPDESIVYARLGGLVKLWLWATPMLLLLAWWGGRESKHNGIRLLGASALVTFFGYFLIRFDQGHGWGYRYFHSAWGVLPILGAAGVLKLVTMPDEGLRWARTLAAMALVSVLAANGLRFFQMGGFMAGHLAQSPPQTAAESRLAMHSGRGYYAYDLIQNDPWLRGSSVILLVQDEEKKLKLLNRFRDRFPIPPDQFTNRFGTTFASPTMAPPR